MSETSSFEFGRNWARYLDRHFSEIAIAAATRCLARVLGTERLDGRTFLDVGCGSGLSSLAAHRMGAARIVSFDVDPQSVECTRKVREREGEPGTWEVLAGSALDESFLADLGRFDVVYAWGSLHHSGEMWKAIDLAARLVSPEGALALAIYNRAEAFGLYPDGRFGPSRAWVPLKRLYCALPGFLQWTADSITLATFWLVCLLTLRNPARVSREFVEQRGMALRTDIRDWLGGYPYEYASPQEIHDYMRERGFRLDNLIYHGGLRCNEYLFRRGTR
jgi:2-polyprenyl-6-hydroxyphenyl methylase/3-demethylubiquinone-9 3-methyltransferase